MSMSADDLEPPGRSASPSGGTRHGWRGLGADLTAASTDAMAALVVTALIFVLLYHRVVVGSSDTLAVMSMVSDKSGHWLYLLCQAFGWSALLWVWITVMLGLLRSSAWANALMPIARVELWHRTTSLTTLALMLGHAVAYAAYSAFQRPAATLRDGLLYAFVPGGFHSPTNGNLGILIGILAFYLAIPLSLSFYLRHRVGGRVFRALHRFIIIVYVVSVWHTLLTGTDLVMFRDGFRTVVWVLQLPVAALLIVRLLAPLRHDQRLQLRERSLRAAPVVFCVQVAARVGAAAVLVLLVALIATGHLGGTNPGQAALPTRITPAMAWIGLVATVVAMTVAVCVAASKHPSRQVKR